MPTESNVSSTEFQARAGLYIELSAKEPIVITKHKRPARVLVDYEEYNRLKKYDTRVALTAGEFDDVFSEELKEGYQGEPTPDLDHLME